MGTDVKGFVSTTNKDFFQVMTLVESVLADLVIENHQWLKERWGKFPSTKVYPSSKSARTSFWFKDEKRSVSVNFDCDCDYSDVYSGAKIILSLGLSGCAQEVMLKLLEALKVYGDVYYCSNDSTEDFIKL
jgi:hypothetical protein